MAAKGEQLKQAAGAATTRAAEPGGDDTSFVAVAVAGIAPGLRATSATKNWTPARARSAMAAGPSVAQSRPGSDRLDSDDASLETGIETPSMKTAAIANYAQLAADRSPKPGTVWERSPG